MFNIYIDKEALAKICSENAGKGDVKEQTAWYRIIVNQEKVYANITAKLSSINDYENEIQDLDNSADQDIAKIRELVALKKLAALSKDEQTNVLPCEKVDIDAINPQNPETYKLVANDPCAVYLLNVEPNVAKIIQDKYGVICQSTQEDLTDNKLLTGIGVNVCPPKGSESYSWNSILNKFKKIPCSGIVINDRNLFVNDKISSKGGDVISAKTSGLLNVKEILEILVPKQYSAGTFHIMICTQLPSGKSGIVQFEDITKGLEQIRTGLQEKRRGINIDIELFALKDSSSEGYESTHNRRILSNYFIFTFEHKINAFDGRKSRCTQAVNGHRLYHEGIYDDGCEPAEIMHRCMIEEFSKFMKTYTDIADKATAANKDNTVRYSLNGVEKKLSGEKSVVNRILFPGSGY